MTDPEALKERLAASLGEVVEAGPRGMFVSAHVGEPALKEPGKESEGGEAPTGTASFVSLQPLLPVLQQATGKQVELLTLEQIQERKDQLQKDLRAEFRV